MSGHEVNNVLLKYWHVIVTVALAVYSYSNLDTRVTHLEAQNAARAKSWNFEKVQEIERWKVNIERDIRELKRERN